jgi:hypothetical protein
MHHFRIYPKVFSWMLPVIVIVGLFLSIAAFTPAAHADGNGSSTLNAPDALWAGQQLVSPNGQYSLDMQTDGNLVIYGNGKALWGSGTNGTGSNNVLVMQSDGNLVIWSGSTAVWGSGTNGSGSNNSLAMQNDGNLVVYTSTGHAVWGSNTPADTLFAPQTLWAGQYIHSLNSQYNADMQTDGNFVVYNGSTPIWASETFGSGYYVSMQNDGNLVVYSNTNVAQWSSNTAGNGSGGRLTMQNDGNLVAYTSAGNPTWASQSSGNSAQVTEAINWAEGQLGSDSYNLLCLQFVANAWSAAGVNIGSEPDALTYWNTNPNGYSKTAQNSYPSTTIPAGALVFWGNNQYASDGGHVAISLGNGSVISSPAYPYSSTDSNAVFEFALTARPASTYNYLGWMMP